MATFALQQQPSSLAEFQTAAGQPATLETSPALVEAPAEEPAPRTTVTKAAATPPPQEQASPLPSTEVDEGGTALVVVAGVALTALVVLVGFAVARKRKRR